MAGGSVLRCWRRGHLGVGGVVVAALCGVFSWCAPVADAATCQTGAVTFTSTGVEQCYTVAPGVTELSIRAVGGKGGDGVSSSGGFGALVTGVIWVTPGETLYVEVGANGANAPYDHSTTFGGGGAGGSDAGAGGGASDVRTVPSAQGASSLSSRVLVAAGGGAGAVEGTFGTGPVPAGPGGAAGGDLAGNGQAGGDGGTRSMIAMGGGGGGGATSSAAGGAGAGGNGELVSGPPGVAGTFGGAGAGVSGGGGGGGGYYGGGGGGGGGTDNALESGGSGGGGAGSSFAARFVQDASIATDTTGTPEVVLSSLVAALAFSPSAGVAFPGTQPEQTIGAPQSVTVSNTGTGPLEISGLTLAGSDPQDFLITSNGCLGQIAASASCTLGVSFAPQGQGARTATLQIASNAPGSPASVPLSGTGGQLPQGPTGAAGQAGPAGPQGPAGKIELVVCKTVTKQVFKGTGRKRHKVKVTQQKCTARLVSGTVKFVTAHAASISRGHVTYAKGYAASLGDGRWQLVLTDRRSLRRGSYTLTLRSRHNGRWVTSRRSITIG